MIGTAFIHSRVSRIKLSVPEPVTVLAPCDYCGRAQERPPSGGCVSCGAPLPLVSVRQHEHHWLEMTCHGDRHRRFWCSCGGEEIESFDGEIIR